MEIQTRGRMTTCFDKTCLFCLHLDRVLYFKYGYRNKCCLVCARGACRNISVLVISLIFLVGFIGWMAVYRSNSQKISVVSCLLLNKFYTPVISESCGNETDYILDYQVLYSPNSEWGSINRSVCDWRKECYTCGDDATCNGTEGYHSCNRVVDSNLDSFNSYQVNSSYQCYCASDQPENYIFFSNPVSSKTFILSFVCLCFTICFWVYMFLHFICDYSHYRGFSGERTKLLRPISKTERAQLSGMAG